MAKKRGPKPTPKAILKLRGSWRGDIPDEPPIIKPQRVRCPKWISPAAQKEFRAISSTLNYYGLCNELNKIIWAVYCSYLADLKKIETEIAKILAEEPASGLFPEKSVMSKKSATNLKVLVTIRTDLARQICTILKDAGISPELIQPPAIENKKARFFKDRTADKKKERGPYAKDLIDEPPDGAGDAA